MDMQAADIEPVTVSDILDLATWNRQRTSAELQSFINSHHDRLPDSIEIEQLTLGKPHDKIRTDCKCKKYCAQMPEGKQPHLLTIWNERFFYRNNAVVKRVD